MASNDERWWAWWDSEEGAKWRRERPVFPWEKEMARGVSERPECERCGKDHGDGLTCTAVERWETWCNSKEGAWWRGKRISLVHVGDRVYLSYQTEAIEQAKRVLEKQSTD